MESDFDDDEQLIDPEPIDSQVAVLGAASSGGEKPNAARALPWLVAAAIAAAGAVIIARQLRTETTAETLRPGDCVELPDAATFEDVRRIDCALTHTREVYAVGESAVPVPSPIPKGSVAEGELVRICYKDVAKPLGALLQKRRAAISFFTPKAGTRVVCVAATEFRTGSLVAEAG